MLLYLIDKTSTLWLGRDTPPETNTLIIQTCLSGFFFLQYLNDNEEHEKKSKTSTCFQKSIILVQEALKRWRWRLNIYDGKHASDDFIKLDIDISLWTNFSIFDGIELILNGKIKESRFQLIFDVANYQDYTCCCHPHTRLGQDSLLLLFFNFSLHVIFHTCTPPACSLLPVSLNTTTFIFSHLVQN